MNAQCIQMIARIALTALIIYFVYLETGPWTAAALALIAVSIEFDAFLMRKWGEVIEIHNDILKHVTERKP